MPLTVAFLIVAASHCYDNAMVNVALCVHRTTILQLFSPLKPHSIFTISCKLTFRSGSIQTITDGAEFSPYILFSVLICFTQMYVTLCKKISAIPISLLLGSKN